MKDNLIVNFTTNEKECLKKLDIPYKSVMNFDEANNIVETIADLLQSLELKDMEIGEDIITKITTNKNW